jgi:hypothetical protein
VSIEKLARGEELTIGEQNVLVSEYDELRRNVRLLRGLVAGATRHVQADELSVYGNAEIGSDLAVGGTIEVAGNVNAEGDISAQGKLEASGGLEVTGGGSIIGVLKVGSPDTNYTQWNSSGSLSFVGTAGMQFGEIYANDANSSHAISSAGEASKVQIVAFDTNGVSNGMTPDKDQNHIVVTTPGKYLCTASLAVASAGGGGADRFGMAAYKNNGATKFPNLHGHRLLKGGGGDFGSVSLSGVIAAASSDTIELWLWNEDSTDDIVVDDVTLSMVQIGG